MSKMLNLVLVLLLCHVCKASELPDPGLSVLVQKADQCFRQLKYDSAGNYYLEVLRQIDQKNDNELFCHLRNRYAATLLWQDKLSEAEPVCIDNLQKCNELLGNTHPETATAHLNLGSFKFINGSDGVIFEHFQEAAYIFEDCYGKVNPETAKAYEWLGTFYESRADTINSRKYLWKSFNIWKKAKGPDHPDLAEIYRYMGLYFKRFYKHDSALICFKKARLLFDSKYGQANFQSVKCLNNMADIYAEQPSFEQQVLPTYQLCNELITQFPSPNRMAKVMTLYNIAEYKQFKGKIMESLDYMNQILACYFTDFKNNSVYENPVNITDFPNNIIKLVLFFKADAFIRLAVSDPSNKMMYLKSAHECYYLANLVVDEMRKSIKNLDDRLRFSNSYARMYDIMAINDLNLFQLTKDTIFLEYAMNYLTKKSMTEDRIKTGTIKLDYSFIPEKVNIKLARNTTMINELKARKVPDNKKEKHDRQIIQRTLESEALYAQINRLYEYSSAERENSPIVFHDFKKLLRKNDCLLWYSEYKNDNINLPDSLIIIAISSDKVIIKIIPGIGTFRLINEYYRLLSNKEDDEKSFATGAALYRALIQPVEDILTRNIIILPSARVSRISFEALPDLYVSEYKDAPLLIENHLIWKLFSYHDLSSWTRNDLNYRNDSLLAVAPVFNKSKAEEISVLAERDSNLINLAGTVLECKTIANFFETNLLSGFNATEDKFKEICNQYPYIHISTHCAPNHEIRENMQLAFSASDGKQDDGWLNFYEILNLELKAELVVLSACKTGVGKANNGEGSLNLAWAFRQAGARSTVVSLWDVNDYASNCIMPAFYQYISEGYSRPESLRKAKLHYIKTNDATATLPFYWAAFDFIGEKGSDNSNINLLISNWVLPGLIALFLAIGLFIFLFRLRIKTF
jgi:CHAT domain-containing protein